MSRIRLNFIRSPVRLVTDNGLEATRSVSGSPLPGTSASVAGNAPAARSAGTHSGADHVNSRRALDPNAETAAAAPAAAADPGVSQAEHQQMTALLAQLVESVLDLQDQQRQSLSEMQHAAVELAVAAASWLTGAAIEAGQFAVDDLVKMALHRLEADTPVRVHMNPRDHSLLKTLTDQTAESELLERIVCVEDPDLPRGNCRFEAGRRTLMTDLETRLEEIRRLWMENLDATQVERRADGSHGRSLRRFPDRRETA